MFTQRRVFEILEKGWVDDRQSLYCDLFLSALIIVNLIAICLETIDSLFAAYKTVFVVIELVSVLIFALEYGLGIWSRPAAPNDRRKTTKARRVGYIFSFTNQVSMRRNQLEAEITSALSDGVISKDERKKIENLRQRLNISEQDASAIISYLSREAKAAQRGREDS